MEKTMTHLQLREAHDEYEGRARLRLTCLSEMRGSYPHIPLPEDIDRAALGEDAFFVTLPIGQAGAQSRNGRTYSRAAVEGMVAQINARRPEGMWGHLSEAEAGTRYSPPAIRWLAACMDAEGVAWGKGLPLTDETREYYRLAKATNARVGTSLYAWASMEGDQVAALELITLDLADPARVGVTMTAAKPMLTGEMEQPRSSQRTSVADHSGNARMKQANRIAELERARDEAETRAAEMAGALFTYQTAVEQIGALVGVSESVAADEVVRRARELLEERAALLDDALVSLVERSIRLPSVRPVALALARARQPMTRTAVIEAVEAVAADEGLHALLRDELARAAGPSHVRPASREGSERYFTVSK
jgi:hypothetical protein